jgi:hypothetical protein
LDLLADLWRPVNARNYFYKANDLTLQTNSSSCQGLEKPLITTRSEPGELSEPEKSQKCKYQGIDYNWISVIEEGYVVASKVKRAKSLLFSTSLLVLLGEHM